MRFVPLISVVTLSGLTLSAPTFLHKPSRTSASTAVDAKANANAKAVADVIAHRQHHPKRALIDVCAHLDASALASAGITPLARVGAGAKAELCLCASLFPLNVKLLLDAGLGVVTDALGGLLGAHTTLDAKLKALVGSHGDKCTYPSGAQPFCSSSEPCGFTCPAGRIREGNACVCAAGLVDCNGKCQSKTQACGSAVPRAFRTDAHMQEKRLSNLVGKDKVIGQSHAYTDVEANTKAKAVLKGASSHIRHPRDDVDASAAAAAHAQIAVVTDALAHLDLSSITATASAAVLTHADVTTHIVADIDAVVRASVRSTLYTTLVATASVKARVVADVKATVDAALDASVALVARLCADVRSKVDATLKLRVSAKVGGKVGTVMKEGRDVTAQDHADANVNAQVTGNAVAHISATDIVHITASVLAHVVARIDASIHTVADLHASINIDALVRSSLNAVVFASGSAYAHLGLDANVKAHADVLAGICADVKVRLDAALAARVNGHAHVVRHLNTDAGSLLDADAYLLGSALAGAGSHQGGAPIAGAANVLSDLHLNGVAGLTSSGDLVQGAVDTVNRILPGSEHLVHNCSGCSSSPSAPGSGKLLGLRAEEPRFIRLGAAAAAYAHADAKLGSAPSRVSGRGMRPADWAPAQL